MAGFIAELKRRNVFKVATIYVVVSWLLLQVATVVFPVFDIPMWASRLVVLLLALGFPVAMVLAWALELTPEGIEWDPNKPGDHVHTHAWDWILGILLVVAIGMMVVSQIDYWQEANEQAGAPTTLLDAPQPEPVEESLPSIAILPFDSRSASDEDDYFADGLSDELLSTLFRIGEIRVASRTSTAYFKGKDVDHATIGAKLSVEHILSGTVRRNGDRIRVTAALDDTDSGQLLWTETFDRRIVDILDIQSEIAQAVVAEVAPILSPKSQDLVLAQPTENTLAYDLYLQGLDYLRRPAEEETLARAATLFEQAANADPRFAQAYAGICRTNLAKFDFNDDTSNFESAELACHRALTLNNSLWDVHLALARLYQRAGQNNKALLELQAAIAQQPNAVEPFITMAQIYAAEGRMVDAEATFRKAEQIEGGYWGVHRAFGNFLFDLSRYEEAIVRHQRVIELAPETGIGQDNLGNTYLALGDLDSALTTFNSSPDPSRWTYANRGLVYYYLGDFEKAAEDQSRAIAIAPDVHAAHGQLADAYRQMGGKDDEARASYERAIELAEKQLQIYPDYWSSKVRLALYYLHTGRVVEADRHLSGLFQLTQDSAAYFFSAIAAAVKGDEDLAYDFLDRSLSGGFAKDLVLVDPDLAPLLELERFKALLARY